MYRFDPARIIDPEVPRRINFCFLSENAREPNRLRARPIPLSIAVRLASLLDPSCPFARLFRVAGLPSRGLLRRRRVVVPPHSLFHHSPLGRRPKSLRFDDCQDIYRRVLLRHVLRQIPTRAARRSDFPEIAIRIEGPPMRRPHPSHPSVIQPLAINEYVKMRHTRRLRLLRPGVRLDSRSPYTRPCKSPTIALLSPVTRAPTRYRPGGICRLSSKHRNERAHDGVRILPRLPNIAHIRRDCERCQVARGYLHPRARPPTHRRLAARARPCPAVQLRHKPHQDAVVATWSPGVVGAKPSAARRRRGDRRSARFALARSQDDGVNARGDTAIDEANGSRRTKLHRVKAAFCRHPLVFPEYARARLLALCARVAPAPARVRITQRPRWRHNAFTREKLRENPAELTKGEGFE